jgi:hypothetical protein
VHADGAPSQTSMLIDHTLIDLNFLKIEIDLILGSTETGLKLKAFLSKEIGVILCII